MIQRVQSIWLFLAGLTIFLLILLPIVSNQVNGAEFWIQGTGLFQKTIETTQKVQSFRPLYLTIIALTVYCFAVIFSFRNRSTQKLLIIIAIILIILLAFWTYNYAQKIPGGLANASYSIGAYLPLASILFCVLAFRGIRKDEQLLKSADRLR